MLNLSPNAIQLQMSIGSESFSFFGKFSFSLFHYVYYTLNWLHRRAVRHSLRHAHRRTVVIDTIRGYLKLIECLTVGSRSDDSDFEKGGLTQRAKNSEWKMGNVFECNETNMNHFSKWHRPWEKLPLFDKVSGGFTKDVCAMPMSKLNRNSAQNDKTTIQNENINIRAALPSRKFIQQNNHSTVERMHISKGNRHWHQPLEPMPKQTTDRETETKTDR